MSTFPDWWNDPARRRKALELKLGLIHRPQLDVPHIPKGSKVDIELGLFQEWAIWFAAGHAKPRPPALNHWLPAKDYWGVEAEFIAKRHAPPPPPPPPKDNPPSRWKDAPWYRPHLDISHGLRKVADGGQDDGVWTVDELVDRCLRYGVKSIGAQFGDDCPDRQWYIHIPQLYRAAKAKGIQVYGWGRTDYRPWDEVKADIRRVMPLDGISADCEGAGQDMDLPRHLFAEFGDECPLSVVATGGIDNYFGTDAIDSAVRFGDYFDFRGQDYYKFNADPPFPMTLDMGENFVYWRGTEKNGGKGYRHLPKAGNKWHVALLMSNAEGCTPLSEQKERAKAWVRSGGVVGFWDGEILDGNDEWDVLAEIFRAA